ncbi:MAG TPA: hypothetical protein PK771_06670 [Spirochaetota bacterium]|nr:hypothetical protein [Spirochaetota bacterium]
MDEANSLSNKEKLLGFTSSNYFSFSFISYQNVTTIVPFAPYAQFGLLIGLNLPYNFNCGFMYRVGLKHNDEFSFASSVNYLSTNQANSMYVPFNFDFGYKKELFKKDNFSSAYKINLGHTIGPSINMFFPMVVSTFIIKNSFLFTFNSKDFNFSLNPSFQFGATINIPFFVFMPQFLGTFNPAIECSWAFHSKNKAFYYVYSMDFSFDNNIIASNYAETMFIGCPKLGFNFAFLFNPNVLSKKNKKIS